MLEPPAERLRQAAHGGGVDQPHVDHVAKVNAILQAKRRELHHDQPIEAHDPIALERFCGREVGGWHRILRLHPLPGEEDVHRLAGLAVGAVDEGIDANGEGVNESGFLEGRLHGLEVGARHEQIDIDRSPHGCRVDP